MAIDANDPEIKALIEEAVNKATEPLVTKNRELLSEVKAAKAKAKGADIDPAEFAALQQHAEEMQARAEKAEKLFKVETEKLTKALSEKDGSLRQILVDQGLTEYAVRAGVASHYLEAVKAIHGPKVQIEQKDGQMVAMLGGKPLGDALTEWVSSDAGKHYAAAPQNTGGGAGGGANKPADTKPVNLVGDKAAQISRAAQLLKEAGAI
jgi:hypothetical protein